MPSDHPGNVAANTNVLANVTDDEAQTRQTLSEESLKNGRQYVFRETFTRSTADPSLDILIHHPAGADNTLRVVERVIDPTKALTGTLTPNVDITTDGTEFDVINKNITDPADTVPVPNAQYGGTYDKDASPNTDALTVDVFDTGQGATRVARSDSTAAFRLEPGTNIYYDLESQADGNDILIQFIVSQRP